MSTTARAKRLLWALLMGLGSAQAANITAIRPGNGIHRIDLLGDGTPAMVVVGRRDNGNAHGIDIASLYLRVHQQWLSVVRFDAPDDEHDQLHASGGADCVLQDFRLIRRGAHRSLGLVVAERDFGDGFVDRQPVRFRVYRLTHGDDVGRPTWFFEQTGAFTSVGRYCDVGPAFQLELASHADLWAH